MLDPPVEVELGKVEIGFVRRDGQDFLLDRVYGFALGFIELGRSSPGGCGPYLLSHSSSR